MKEGSGLVSWYVLPATFATCQGRRAYKVRTARSAYDLEGEGRKAARRRFFTSSYIKSSSDDQRPWACPMKWSGEVK